MTTDYQGLTNVITATGALISSIGVIVLGVLKYRSRNDVSAVAAKVDQIQTTVDGHTERIEAAKDAANATATALGVEVVRLQAAGTTTPTRTEDPGAPVTLDRGIVNTEKRP